MSASNEGSQGHSSGSDDFFLTIALIVGGLAALFFFGKDLIIAYWKVMRLLDLWMLGKISPAYFHPGSSGDVLWQFLLHHTIPKTTWSAVSTINSTLDHYLSIGPFQAWPIFWSLLPAALAIPLWNRGKNLKKTFAKPWDLALYMSKQYPWMLPVIRHRSSALKNNSKTREPESFGAADGTRAARENQ